jgi:hypothetical protein
MAEVKHRPQHPSRPDGVVARDLGSLDPAIGPACPRVSTSRSQSHTRIFSPRASKLKTLVVA